jgi:transglutaminase-like putative cysteine protease
MVRDGRWDVLEIRPGDAQELCVKSKIVHTPRVLGWRRLESVRSKDIPPGAKVCLGPFTNSQKYDPANPELQKAVQDLKGATPAETVQNVLDWMAKNMRYEAGHSDKLEDMLASHRGVCHHYSNLTVAMCRALGVPAVVAHGSHFPDHGTFKDDVPSHGWVEVYLGGLGWVPIDPLSPNSLRCFWAPGYMIVDTSGYGPDDNHFYMKTSKGKHLQSIQGAPASGTAELVGEGTR